LGGWSDVASTMTQSNQPEPIATKRLKRHLDLAFLPDRFSYAGYAPLLEAGSTLAALDALMKVLKVPGKPTSVQRLGPDEKADAIIKQIEHLRTAPTSPWKGAHSADVFVGMMYESATPEMRAALFGAVANENALKLPVAAQMRSRGLDVFHEIPMGQNQADLVGHRAPALLGMIDATVVAIELKNDLRQLKRGFDQLTTYQDYATETYLACTPALAHEYLRAHARARGVHAWDPEALNRKLTKLGVGLLLVEGDSVETVLSAEEQSLTKARYREVKDQLLDVRRVR
jgi:hypothetical protein